MITVKAPKIIPDSEFKEKTMKTKLILGLAMFSFCLIETPLGYAGHDGGHSMRSSRTKFIRGSGSSGPFQMTKGSTGSTSSTTSRDRYSSFLRDQYEEIREQVAQGEGKNLEIIALYSGCEGSLMDAMKFELNANYRELFNSEGSQPKLEAEINKLIEGNDQLRNGCQVLQTSEI